MQIFKLLVNAPSGAQEIVEVEESGSYFDATRVLWDERVDGPLPTDVQLGGMYRQGLELLVDTALAEAHEATELAASRAAVWEAIKVERDRLSQTGGYPVSTDDGMKWFHSDTKSQVQQIGLRMMGASVPPVMWKTMDGTKVPMTATLASSIFIAAATQDMALFAAAEAHRAAMEASADPLNYDFSGNWPEVFQDV